MRVEVNTPELSESVQSGTLLEWRKSVGEAVRRDEVVADLETDKVILEVTAPAAGVLVEIRVAAGEEVAAGAVLAEIDTEAAAAAPAPDAVREVEPPPQEPAKAAIPPPPPVVPAAKPAPEPPVIARHLRPSARKAEFEAMAAAPETDQAVPAPDTAGVAPSSLPARAPVAEQVAGCPPCPPCPPCEPCPRSERRVPMSRLRQRIAERLKEAQNTAAILTTFNEINMQPVQDLRGRYQERFQKEHGVKLGLMSFFVKAACQALKQFPGVNASIDGRDIVYHDYYDIGVAVSSERGLVVPVLRGADELTFAEIEKRIADFGRRANSLELTIEELEGGTFTLSNGGIFGSLLSTPILNPPQSGVLGLHKIQDRPVAENGQVVIRPMMYVALSYDHRLIDGREAVSFLRTLKEALEDPARLLLEL
jgi:2-oxoglutarate dehydrogenase E2 component (dihydrolipoamide succinyltransferase)